MAFAPLKLRKLPYITLWEPYLNQNSPTNSAEEARFFEEHEAQLFNYMRVSRKAVGYLVNLGRKGGLEWKRFVVNDLHEKPLPAMPRAEETAEKEH